MSKAFFKSAVQWLAYLTGFAWVCGMCFAFGSAFWALHDMPELPDLTEQRRPVSVSFYDRHDQLIGVRGAVPSRPANLDLLPDHLPAAIIAIEDRRFYGHFGLDPKGLARAAYRNHKAGRIVEGGSTLSQQLAKNLFLTPDRTLKRKAQEAFIALHLETQFTKRELMELYLGRVYFGAGAYGIDAAAERYFAKSSADLTLAQSAILAGLLKAPAAYAPERDPTAAAQRGAIVLGAMVRDQIITPDHYKALMAEQVWIEPTVRSGAEHYFLDYAWAQMEQNIGVPEQDLRVYTTLDLALQNRAALLAAPHLSPRRGASEYALVTLDGQGGIRMMIGGADYSASQFNRAALAKRQPGSSFKPFVYLAAIEAGISPDDIRIDAPITLGDWSPQNFKPEHLGEVTVERAFALSLNTVAVSLSEEIGRERVVDTAARFGLTGLEPLRSLPLGAQEFTPIEMAQAYLPFASYGQSANAFAITEITTPTGKPVWQYSPEPAQTVISPDALRQMNRLMLAVTEKGTGRAARVSGWDIAGKTGTTNDYRDAWFIGYAPDMVTVVWTGNDDYQPMSRVTGGTIPAQIFAEVMTEALKDRRPASLPRAVPSVVITPAAPPQDSALAAPLP